LPTIFDGSDTAVSPTLIISLGSFAARELDRLRGAPSRSLSQLVGKIEDWGRIRIAYLPHTSGSSRFLNTPENRAAFALACEQLSIEIGRLRLTSSDAR
jgi:uracil-DNA glycosylase